MTSFKTQAMARKVFGLFLALFMFGLIAQAAPASKTNLATITGAVLDNKGNPVSGALISLVRDGASKVIKETRSDVLGRFSARVAPGRYGIRAIAAGFNEVVFTSVDIHPSQELVYRFNLEPIGSGKTLPERRRDRDDVKWTLRSAQSRRSIFQEREGQDGDIQAVLDAEEAANDSSAEPTASPSEGHGLAQGRVQAVVETYFAGNSFGASYPGMNFAVAASPNDRVELIFSGQTTPGANGPERFEAAGHVRAGARHRVGVSFGTVRFGNLEHVGDANSLNSGAALGQLSVRAVDEWIVRDGIVVVLGLDYSKFLSAGNARSVSPRIGLQYDVNARTRLRAAYAPGGDEREIQRLAEFEGSSVAFRDSSNRPIAYVDGRAVMDRSHRLEFGVERVIDNKSNLEANAFFDTTTARAVGLLSTPSTAFSGPVGEAFINVANQQGAARGMRLVYTRRLSRMWTASGGYAFGRGQRLASLVGQPNDVFENGFFQSAALQLGVDLGKGTNVRTVLRFSPNATVFAIDPFAGRLAVYDPSLSVQVTQELPTFGLPVRAEAVLDARNLLDVQTAADNGETLTQMTNGRRSVRGGISLRF